MTEIECRPSTVFAGRVDEDAAAAFALATNDANPRYQDGRAVPPLYTGAMILEAQVEAQISGIGHDDVTGWTIGVHGQHDVRFHQPVRPGAHLRYWGHTYSARQTKGGVLVAQLISVTDLDGQLLVEHLWSNFFAGGSIATEYGPPLPDHSFAERFRDRLVGTRAVPVHRDQAYRYAGVSGDHVGHAMDDEIARSEGFAGKILQGMCTFGLASGALVDMTADGDPDRIARLAVRFAAPARPSADIVVRVYAADRTESGARAYAFEAEQDGVFVLKHGRVELRD
ncbi:MAG TPA: MaoC/PaaZ C-terminal domain-containing protein [Acidimicrobiales bacterium]|nr:MaoC/PaaZ C-terminal domain-containing protein [Acidimicrobiales bacterium]